MTIHLINYLSLNLLTIYGDLEQQSVWEDILKPSVGVACHKGDGFMEGGGSIFVSLTGYFKDTVKAYFAILCSRLPHLVGYFIYLKFTRLHEVCSFNSLTIVKLVSSM